MWHTEIDMSWKRQFRRSVGRSHICRIASCLSDHCGVLRRIAGIRRCLDGTDLLDNLKSDRLKVVAETEAISDPVEAYQEKMINISFATPRGVRTVEAADFVDDVSVFSSNPSDRKDAN